MTARWARLPCDFLDHVSRRISSEVRGISRVTYDISRRAARDDRVGVTEIRPLPAGIAGATVCKRSQMARLLLLTSSRRDEL